MDSKRNRILNAIRDLLIDATPAARDVYRERRRAIRAGATYAINIVPESDPRQDSGGMTVTDRFMTVDIQIHARGDVPTEVADPVVVVVHELLIGANADRTLGGLALDIVAGDNDFEYDDADEDMGAVHQRYAVLYRTGETDLTD
jgi:hypothetical protein